MCNYHRSAIKSMIPSGRTGRILIPSKRATEEKRKKNSLPATRGDGMGQDAPRINKRRSDKRARPAIKRNYLCGSFVRVLRKNTLRPPRRGWPRRANTQSPHIDCRNVQLSISHTIISYSLITGRVKERFPCVCKSYCGISRAVFLIIVGYLRRIETDFPTQM